MRTTFRLTEPCTRAFNHLPHHYEILLPGATNIVSVICIGWNPSGKK